MLKIRMRGPDNGIGPSFDTSNVVLPFSLAYLEFNNDLDRAFDFDLFAQLIQASSSNLVHVNLIWANWTNPSRRKLFTLLRPLASQLLSLGLPFERCYPVEDDEESEGEVVPGQAEYETGETENPTELSPLELALVASCTSLRTLGCHRLPRLDECAPSIHTIFLHYFDVFPPVAMEECLRPFLPQLRWFRAVNIDEPGNLILLDPEFWEGERQEAGVDLVCNDWELELEFGDE